MNGKLYWPDLALCNVWLFPKLKNAMMGQRFADTSDIQGNVTLLSENDFQDHVGLKNTVFLDVFTAASIIDSFWDFVPCGCS
jgi:hypothetical protein